MSPKKTKKSTAKPRVDDLRARRAAAKERAANAKKEAQEAKDRARKARRLFKEAKKIARRAKAELAQVSNQLKKVLGAAAIAGSAARVSSDKALPSKPKAKSKRQTKGNGRGKRPATVGAAKPLRKAHATASQVAAQSSGVNRKTSKRRKDPAAPAPESQKEEVSTELETSDSNDTQIP